MKTAQGPIEENVLRKEPQKPSGRFSSDPNNQGVTSTQGDGGQGQPDEQPPDHLTATYWG